MVKTSCSQQYRVKGLRQFLMNHEFNQAHDFENFIIEDLMTLYDWYGVDTEAIKMMHKMLHEVMDHLMTRCSFSCHQSLKRLMQHSGFKAMYVSHVLNLRFLKLSRQISFNQLLSQDINPLFNLESLSHLNDYLSNALMLTHVDDLGDDTTANVLVNQLKKNLFELLHG